MSTITYSTETKVGSSTYIPARLLTAGIKIKYAGEIFSVLEIKRWGDREIVLTCTTAEMRATVYLSRNEKVQVINQK